MKKLSLCFTLIFLFTVSFSFGQEEEEEGLSKDEKKKLKAELKAMKKSPEKLQRMKNSLGTLNSEVNAKVAEIQSLEAQIATLDQELQSKKSPAQFRSDIEELRKQKQELEARIAFWNKNKPDGSGVVYRVQIGAYLNTDFSQYADKHPNFTVDGSRNNFKRYLVGYFRDYAAAKYFSQYVLMSMEPKPRIRKYAPMVVAYQDGQRIENLQKFLKEQAQEKEGNVETPPEGE